MEPIRVLYVDDDDDIREIALICLEHDGGFEARTCASGRLAVEEVANWQPDIVLLDVMMPEMDGPETLRVLRTLTVTASVPVVFITARTHANDVGRFLALGAVGVIAKPFDPMTLGAQVRAYAVPGASQSAGPAQ